MKTVMVTNIGGNAIIMQKKLNLNRQVGSFRHSVEEQRFGSVVKLGMRKKGKQSSAKMVATTDAQNSTTVKLSALVSVRSNKVLGGNEMVNNLLTIFYPQNDTKALVLQLVSTKLHPGTCPPSTLHHFYLPLFF